MNRAIPKVCVSVKNFYTPKRSHLCDIRQQILKFELVVRIRNKSIIANKQSRSRKKLLFETKICRSLHEEESFCLLMELCTRDQYQRKTGWITIHAPNQHIGAEQSSRGKPESEREEKDIVPRAPRWKLKNSEWKHLWYIRVDIILIYFEILYTNHIWFRRRRSLTEKCKSSN